METFDKKLFRERFLQAVEEATREKNIPTYKLAVRCDIPPATFSNYLAGTYIPTAKNIYQICSTLNVSADWLIGLSDKRRR